MNKKYWQAYYFKGDDHSQPPARTEVIEAPCYDEAVKIAAAHLESCKRVDVECPRWVSDEVRTVFPAELATQRH